MSFDAIELINSLLQEKEHRLSSKKYRLNDYQPSRRTPGQPGSRLADPHARDYQGTFVYPDDATDIKAHHFFRRISWDRLHLSRPPFVPDVSGGDDTKYFDDEEPISDVDDAASSSHALEASDEEMHDVAPSASHVTQVDGPEGADQEADRPVPVILRLREKKRPRDKVLRDRRVGRKALELRKKGAFHGYTYRRPLLPVFEEERGRQRVARRSQIPSFD